MGKQLKCIGSSILITLSFVFGIGIISSAAMIAMRGGPEQIAFISGMAQALYLLVVLLFLKRKGTAVRTAYGLVFVPWNEYLLPVIAAFCFSAFSNIVQAVVPIPAESAGGMSGGMEHDTAALLVSVFIIAPVVEEFVFRALIITRLRRDVSAAASMIVSAVLFALIHVMAGGMITVVHAFLGGLIFALAYIKTRSLLPAIAAHISGNAGGYVPDVTDGLPAAVFFTAAIICCAGLARKKTKALSP